MEEQIKILPVLPDTFEYQQYSQEDNQLISASILDTVFSSSTDYIEYYAYDENKNLIYPTPPVKAAEVTSYKVIEGDTLLYPDVDLENIGYVQGSYYSTYNFYRVKCASDITINYYISEISSDRTEVRLKSNAIENDLIVSSTTEFIEQRAQAEYFVDFLLNFGNDQQVIANNISLDTQTEEEASILIKLYEPLPSAFQVKSTLWIVEEISTSQAYNVIFPQLTFEDDSIEYIAGPNYSLNIKNETGESSEIFSYNTLINSDITSSTSQIKNLLDRKEINININYENYNEFVNFSSAKTRLENFVYKVGLIQSSSAVLSASFGAVEGSTTGSTVFSSSKAVEEAKINDIITNFDGYEYWLYFNSGSKYSYPKITTAPPFALAATSSTMALNWETEQATSASEYDENNQNALYFAIPEYLRSDPDNARYELFVDMVGQHYDNVWTYTKDLTNRFDGDNRLDYGISKDLVADAIRDFGVKLYSNNFNTDDLYTAFLGLTPSGSEFPLPNITSSYPAASGFEYVDTKISASNDIVPLDNANKRLYKRIYHNIPYLLKTKGTITGLRALITSYGIPNTILRINEFGGKDRIATKDWDLKQDQFNNSYELDRSTYFSSSFELKSEFRPASGIYTPRSLQFRFKTIGVPTASLYQVVWAGNESTAIITLEYTGSGYESGSYSGSVVSASNEFATMRLYPEGTSDLTVSASVQVPFFNKDWWSVQANVTDTTASLFVGNKVNGNLQYSASNSVTGVDTSLWNSVVTSSFPSYQAAGLNLDGQDHQPLTASIQEIRYWNQALSESKFLDYVVNPYSSEGNTVNSTPSTLTFRADLGSQLDTGSRTSTHPKVTGSWETTASFKTVGSSFYLSDGTKFSNNKEEILLNQTPGGIKNRVSDKIQLANNVIPSGSTLSPFRKVTQSPYISGSEPNINYLEVAFSPQDQINDDIIAQIGAVNLGDYIGNPLQVMQNRMAGEYASGSLYPYSQPASSIPEKDLNPYNYPTLDSLRDAYFLKYINSYDINDFIRLIKFFDNSLFKMIEDFTPARTTLSSGVVVKQNLLERNRYAPPSASYTDETLSGSVKPFARDYNTGSRDYPQDNLISGSSIYTYQGGTGGVFEPFNTTYAAPVYYSGSTTNYSGLSTQQVATSSFYKSYPQVTQSFTESVSSSVGTATVLRVDQREFYNGEFQPAGGAIDFELGEPCRAYFGNDNLEDYFYRIEWFFGNANQQSTYPFYFTSSITELIPSSSQFFLNNATQNASTLMSISTKASDGTSIYNTFNNLSSQTSLGTIKISSTDNTDYLLWPITQIEYKNPYGSVNFQNIYRDLQTTPPATRMEVLFNNLNITASTQAYISYTGSGPDTTPQDQSASLAELVVSASAGIDMGNIKFYNSATPGTNEVEWKITSFIDPIGTDAYVTVNLGALSTGSGIDPFNDFTRVNWSVTPTASGDWFDVTLGTVASQSSASPFSNVQATNIELISTSSFSPVEPQFKKTEQWFLDDANCPGDGYAWFWTEFNKAGQKAKYIKISNKTANNYMINQFIPYSNYITFNLTEARTGGNDGYVVNGFQTWQIANATVMDDGIPATADCSFIFVDPNDSSLAVNSNDPLFTNFSFSSSGQYIWYATGSGIDPNVTPAVNITQSSPQGYFPPVGNYTASNDGALVWFVRENDGVDYVDTNLRINSSFVLGDGQYGGSGSYNFSGDTSFVLDNLSFGVSSSAYRYAMHVKNLSSGELVYTSSQGSVDFGNTTPSGFLSASVNLSPTVVDTYTLSAKAGNVYGITLAAIPNPTYKLTDQYKTVSASYDSGPTKIIQSKEFYGEINTAFILSSSLYTNVVNSGSQNYYLIQESNGVPSSSLFGNANTAYRTITDFSRYNIPRRFPTTQFQKGWGDATYYGNQAGVPTYQGTGSGFLYDPNKNFNTGSKEFDADSTSLINGLYEASTYPWFMNAVPSQSMVSSSLFTTYTLTGDFTSSAVRDKFDRETVNFGPIYTVYTASAPIVTTPTTSSTLPPIPSTTFTCPPLLSYLSNAGGTFNITITPPTSGTNYSSSLMFGSPPASNNQTNVPWASITAGGTGTGTTTLTVSYNAGYTGPSPYVNYSRTCWIRIFEEISGVMTYVGTGCFFQQTYQFQTGGSGGGGTGGGGGGIPGYLPPNT